MVRNDPNVGKSRVSVINCGFFLNIFLIRTSVIPLFPIEKVILAWRSTLIDRLTALVRAFYQTAVDTLDKYSTQKYDSSSNWKWQVFKQNSARKYLLTDVDRFERTRSISGPWPARRKLSITPVKTPFSLIIFNDLSALKWNILLYWEKKNRGLSRCQASRFVCWNGFKYSGKGSNWQAVESWKNAKVMFYWCKDDVLKTLKGLDGIKRRKWARFVLWRGLTDNC